MSDKPFWSINKNGAYCLLFPNKHALSQPEIKEIFSNYGKVLNVTIAGNETGYRFVEYSTMEEAQKAAENLTNHPTIRLIPYCQKKKNNEKTNNTSKSKKNSKNYNNTRKKTQSNKEQSEKKKCYIERKQTKNPINKIKKMLPNDNTELQNKPNKNDVVLSDVNDKCNSNHFINNKNSDCVSTTPNNKFIDEKTAPESIKKFVHSNLENKLLSDSVNFRNKIETLFKLRGSSTNIFSLPDTNTNSSSNTISRCSEDKIPDLVTKNNCRTRKEPKKQILNAEEIIVANIPDNYGSEYILYLFAFYEPLAISYVKVLPNINVKYCHVYFKSVQDSIKVESQFDKYNLSGNKLIVLRPCILMEEAMSND